jgi:hypothetical protein
MLLKNDCVLAINQWETARKNYSGIENLIDPKSVFRFNQDARKWFMENSENEHFHVYFGVFDTKLNLIVVPLEANGKERDLPSYMNVVLSPMTQDVVLVEEEVIRKTKKTTISKNHQVVDVREEVQLPFMNEPIIGETKSIFRIQNWFNQCLDWFYYECMTYEGARIFKTFNVSSVDLVSTNPNVSEVYCFFGFRESLIQNMQVPDLIFVAVDSTCMQVMLNGAENVPVTGNIADFSSPCPPFCNKATDYIIFK